MVSNYNSPAKPENQSSLTHAWCPEQVEGGMSYFSCARENFPPAAFCQCSV